MVDEGRLVAIIETAADEGSWTAAAWLLERLHPERYGRRPRSASQDDARPVPTPEPLPATVSADPFSEVDVLAARRRRPA